MITFTAVVCLAMLLMAGVLSAARVLTDTSVPNRLVAVDLITVLIVLGVCVVAYWRRSDLFLDLVVVVALLGFIAAVTVARFVERRGA